MRISLRVGLFCLFCISYAMSQQAPTISSISPSSGVVGTQITITGTGFGATAGTANVNWTNATIQSWSDTQVVATVAPGTTTGPVLVVNGGVTSNGVTFTMPNPQIASISPSSGGVGTQITITGTGFGATAGTANVNWTNATIQSWSDTQVVATVGGGTSSGGVRVFNGGVSSNAVTFTMPNPQISSVSPTTGGVGTQITITGTGFGASTGTASVNWTNATIQSWSDTQVVATVGGGTSSGGVRVVNAGVSSNAVTFTMPNPQIASISPTSGGVGTQITITGTGFGASTGTASVNWTNATIQSWSDTQVVATVGSGTSSGGVRVVNAGVSSNAVTFSMPNPQITSISPTSGAVGTQITITGTGFGASAGTASVNWTNATIQSWSDTQVVATVGGGTSSGGVRVVNAGVSSNAVTFTMPNPQITSINPSSGTVGTQITITGTGFGASAGTASVNWTNATTQSWSDTQVVATVGGGTSTGGVRVFTGGVSSNAVTFTMPNPQITSVTPTSGAVGTQITITGTGFGASTGTASVNWTNATIQSWSDTQVVATVGSGTSSGGVRVFTGGVSSNPVTFTIGSAAGFVDAGNANTARLLHTGTLLNNGQVLLVGGINNGGFAPISSSDLYDPAGGVFITTGSLNQGRYLHTATLLNDGTVLITGGIDLSEGETATAEQYNPQTGTFALAGNMLAARYEHTATLLNDGTVLISGGLGSLSTAEIYSASTGVFTPTANLVTGRSYHTGTLLNDGMVLIAGGYDVDWNNLNSAELYNPATGTFTATGNLNIARNSQTATLLNNGKVLIAGGFDAEGDVLNTAEVYDPSTGSFTLTGSPNAERAANTATLMNDGTVLFAGGYDTHYTDTASAELFDPFNNTFNPTSSETIARDSHTATLLSNGFVLVAGGEDISGHALKAAELYEPITVIPTGLVSIAINPPNATVPIATAQHLTAIGTFTDTSSQILASVTWSSSDNTVVSVTNDATNRGNSFAVASGSATVKACAGSICGSTQLTVGSSPLSSITIEPGETLVPIGTSSQFLAKGTFMDGGTEDLSSVVTWSSASPSIATVSSIGLASTLQEGSTTITASLGNVSNSASLIVTPTVDSLVVAPEDAVLSVGNTQQFVATMRYSDGTSRDVTNSARWVLINPTYATVTLNPTGLATATSPGTSVIRVSSEGATASVRVDVTTLQLVSISISPPNPSLPLGITEQSTATGTFSDGSTQDLTTAVIWSTSNGAIASISSTGVVTTLAQGSTMIVATSDNVSASSPVVVTGPMLLNATVGPQGIVVALGTNQQLSFIGQFSDGTTQDIATSVTWASSSPGVATVSAAGLMNAVGSGNATISGSINNQSFFTNVIVTAPGPPTITASISPQPNAAGWNNSNVTVSFVCSPGSAAVSSCPAPQIVSSEGASQVVSGTVIDVAGNTATTSVTLNIDETPPILSMASPTDGETVSLGSISSTGTITDNLSGVANLTCNGTVVPLSGGSFSCDVSVNPGLNLVVVRATDLAGNVALSKMHVQCAIPLPSPNVLQITPANVNLVVGETQQFTVVDELGRPRPDAAWAVSDVSIATITSDATPVLTGIAAGQISLSATVEGVSAQVEVTVLSSALSQGTVRWSSPAAAGFTSGHVIQALPANINEPTLYSLEFDNNSNQVIRALTSDGQQMWQRSVAASPGTTIAPDGVGGIFVNDPFNQSITDLDALTGFPLWVVNDFELDRISVSPNGDLFGSGEDSQTPPSLVSFNGLTGQRKTIIQYPTSLVKWTGCGDQQSENHVTPPVNLDANGTAYVEYVIRNETAFQDCHGDLLANLTESTLWLLTVPADGSSSTQMLTQPRSQWVVNTGIQNGYYIPASSTESVLLPEIAIPDGRGGFIASWTETAPTRPYPFMVTHISPGINQTFEIPPLSGSIGGAQLALGENGVAFASNGGSAAGFELNSGDVTVSVATPGPGVMFVSPDNTLTALGLSQYDSSPLSLGLWTGRMNGVASEFVGANTLLAASAFPSSQGGRSPTNSSPLPVFRTFEPVDPGPPAITAQGFLGRYNGLLPLPTRTIGIPRVGSQATFDNFEKDIAETTEAVGFVGHALTVNDLAVALGFWKKFVIPDYLSVNYFGLIGQQFQDGQGNNYVVGIGRSPLKTDAKIIFIASCDLSANNLEQFIGITPQTRHRAAVVPIGVQDIVLSMGEFAWRHIAQRLVQGNNLQEAVNLANQDLDNDPGGWIDEHGKRAPIVHWKVIGDGSISFF